MDYSGSMCQGGNNPPIYKIIMNYYGDVSVPILKCESDQVEWIKEE